MDSFYAEQSRSELNITQCNNGFIVMLPAVSPDQENKYEGLIEGMKEVVKLSNQGDLGLPEDREGVERAPKKRKNYEFERMKNVYIFSTLDEVIDFLKLVLK